MVVGALMLAAQADGRADTATGIDGAWCSPEGQRITIFGGEITTPKGTRLTGTYGGNTFSYMAPPAEPGGGGMVFLTVRPDGRVEVRNGLPTALPRLWQRCARRS